MNIEIIRELLLSFTFSLEQSPSWETNKFLAGEEMVLGSFTLHFGLKYEIIYQLDAIEYVFAFFQLDMFRAYTPIIRSNGCYNFFTVQHATSTHTPQDWHLTTPRTPYAAYVKKL